MKTPAAQIFWSALSLGLGALAACAQGSEGDVGATVVPSDFADAGSQNADGAGTDAGRGVAADANTSAAPDARAADADAGHASGDAALPDARITSDGAIDSAEAGLDAALDAAPTGCTLVVNELMTGVTGAATFEFVEVYNACGTPLDIGGWKLVYRAGTNVASLDPSFDAATLVAWPDGTTVPAHGLRVYVGSGFAGPRDGTLNGGLKDGSGAVAIRTASGQVVDALGYGAGTIDPANPFIEGNAAVANAVIPAPGASIARHPDGHDTDDNHADFTGATPPTPGASN